MKSIAQIAAELAGYDPQALHADQVNAFLQALVQPGECVKIMTDRKSVV